MRARYELSDERPFVKLGTDQILRQATANFIGLCQYELSDASTCLSDLHFPLPQRTKSSLNICTLLARALSVLLASFLRLLCSRDVDQSQPIRIT
jgi:hypothetical protein